MKFSIRDLLLVTVIVAVCVAWWADRQRLKKTYENDVERAINAQIETERWAAGLRADLEQLKKGYSLTPTSSAPAPIPPKP